MADVIEILFNLNLELLLDVVPSLYYLKIAFLCVVLRLHGGDDMDSASSDAARSRPGHRDHWQPGPASEPEGTSNARDTLPVASDNLQLELEDCQC